MFEINGVVWRIYIVSPDHPMLLQPSGRQAIGCCDGKTCAIYISAAIVDSPLFRMVFSHEVAHAAVASYYIDLPIDEEEFLASFISVYGDEIQAIVNRFT